MANTDELRGKISDVTKGNDIGIVIAALAQVVRTVLHQIDTQSPHLSEQARRDFELHLRGPLN